VRNGRPALHPPSVKASFLLYLGVRRHWRKGYVSIAWCRGTVPWSVSCGATWRLCCATGQQHLQVEGALQAKFTVEEMRCAVQHSRSSWLRRLVRAGRLLGRVGAHCCSLSLFSHPKNKRKRCEQVASSCRFLPPDLHALWLKPAHFNCRISLFPPISSSCAEKGCGPVHPGG